MFPPIMKNKNLSAQFNVLGKLPSRFQYWSGKSVFKYWLSLPVLPSVSLRIIQTFQSSLLFVKKWGKCADCCFQHLALLVSFTNLSVFSHVLSKAASNLVIFFGRLGHCFCLSMLASRSVILFLKFSTANRFTLTVPDDIN